MLMAHNMKEIGKLAYPMVLEYQCLLMAVDMKDTGFEESIKAMERIKLLMELLTMVTGLQGNIMESELLLGLTGASIEVNGKTAEKMVKANLLE